MKREPALGAALAVIFLLHAPDSRAQQKAQPAANYGYVFPDDPLAAGGFGPNDVHIRVLQHAMRTTLIRLRTDFVPQLIVSVEKL